MKEKQIFECFECGATYHKWQGKCDSCGAWNTITEKIITPQKEKNFSTRQAGQAFRLIDRAIKVPERISTGFAELDRVLGGGIVPGSTILIGGPPGIGKSTLLTQVAGYISLSGKKVLYLSGEESAEQILLRTSRIGVQSDNLFLLTETDISQLIAELNAENFTIAVVDSIQSIYLPELTSSAGSFSQIRETARILSEIAKSRNISIFLIGHITKDGTIAGPKFLEHMVDVVLYFEEETEGEYRLLKVFKNRYGMVGEIGVFIMGEKGLKDVINPSEVFVSAGAEKNPGSVVSVGLEGLRPFLVEIQALVAPTSYSYPQRVIRGLDTRRTLLILAILEKRCGIPLSRYDCFINVVGGIKIDDPALDVAVALAVVSSFRDIPIITKSVAIGELSLNGNIKPVSNTTARLKEASKLGYTRIIMPCLTEREKNSILKLEIHEVKNIFDAFREALRQDSQ